MLFSRSHEAGNLGNHFDFRGIAWPKTCHLKVMILFNIMPAPKPPKTYFVLKNLRQNLCFWTKILGEILIEYSV